MIFKKVWAKGLTYSIQSSKISCHWHSFLTKIALFSMQSSYVHPFSTKDPGQTFSHKQMHHLLCDLVRSLCTCLFIQKRSETKIVSFWFNYFVSGSHLVCPNNIDSFEEQMSKAVKNISIHTTLSGTCEYNQKINKSLIESKYGVQNNQSADKWVFYCDKFVAKWQISKWSLQTGWNLVMWHV